MAKTTYRFELKLKGCEVVFKTGLSPGVLTTQEAVFPFPEDITDTRKAIALRAYKQDFLDDLVEVVITKIGEEL